jgi:rhodanese-related sulfurtransferase
MTSMTVDALHDKLTHRSTAWYTIIDVRKAPDENQILESVRYNGDQLEHHQNLKFQNDQHLIIYCGSGNSSSRIAQSLRDKGFSAVFLEGGYTAWKNAGKPVEKISEVKEL